MEGPPCNKAIGPRLARSPGSASFPQRDKETSPGRVYLLHGYGSGIIPPILFGLQKPVIHALEKRQVMIEGMVLELPALFHPIQKSFNIFNRYPIDQLILEELSQNGYAPDINVPGLFVPLGVNCPMKQVPASAKLRPPAKSSGCSSPLMARSNASLSASLADRPS